MSKVYLTESFACTFKSRVDYTNTLQALLDQYSAAGWRLHSFETPGTGDFCVVVFERDREE